MLTAFQELKGKTYEEKENIRLRVQRGKKERGTRVYSENCGVEASGMAGPGWRGSVSSPTLEVQDLFS